MTTTNERPARRPAGPIGTLLMLTLAAGCTRPPAAAVPEIEPTRVTSPPVERGDPLEVRLTEPRAADLAELVRTLGVEFHNWKYDGPECAVRLWLEAKDDRVPGLPEIVAESTFDLVGPDGRIYFILVPPASPAPDAPPVAYLGTESWGEKSVKRFALPPLWFGEPDGSPREVSLREEPFSIEEASGVSLVSIHADRTEIDASGKARPYRIDLNLRLTVTPVRATLP